MDPPSEGRGALVIGYGNELRADDGVGRAVAERVAADPRARAVRVMSVRQLTPELALDVAAASLVVLVDAAVDLAPGEVAVRPVADDPASGAFSHHVSAGGLPSLARALYGRTPRVVSVSVGPGSLEPAEGLSPSVALAVPRASELVLGTVSEAVPSVPGRDDA
jgi:hydrogenase maturation protease